MPIYEYQCSTCLKKHEIWQKISDQPKTACPDCSGPLHKLISMSSFQLKGGGWYADGYSSVKREEGKKTGRESELPKKKVGSNEKHLGKQPSSA